jgi:hypothetical protein
MANRAQRGARTPSAGGRLRISIASHRRAVWLEQGTNGAFCAAGQNSPFYSQPEAVSLATRVFAKEGESSPDSRRACDKLILPCATHM